VPSSTPYLYATTAGVSGNSLVQVIDSGPGGAVPAGVQIYTVSPSQTLRGVRLGPAALYRLAVSLSPSGTVVTGQSVQVTVTILNQQGNVASGVNPSTVMLSSSDPTVPNQPLKFVQGQAQTSVTFGTSEGQTVIATDTAGLLASGSSSVFVIAEAQAITFQVPEGTAAVGTPTTIMVSAVDANNNVAIDNTDTISVDSSDSKAVFSHTRVTLQGGTASFQVTFNTAGLQTVNATDAAIGTQQFSSSPIDVV